MAWACCKAGGVSRSGRCCIAMHVLLCCSHMLDWAVRWGLKLAGWAQFLSAMQMFYQTISCSCLETRAEALLLIALKNIPSSAWDAKAPLSSAAALHRHLWLISGKQQFARRPCASARRARRKPRARPAVWLLGVQRACQTTCGLLPGRPCGTAATEGTRQHRLVDSKPSASRPSAGRWLGTNGRLHSAPGHTCCAELAFYGFGRGWPAGSHWN